MTWIALLLIVIAGIAEHYKDLSEEGKLKGYWDKNHNSTVGYWKVGWLQDGVWEYIPVWIRQYLSFRDGWHLLKFISLNSFAVAVVLLAGLPWWWYLVIRFAFSFPETVLRWYENRN